MNPIANWAKQHVIAARWLIALLHVYIFLSAVYLSQLLTGAGIFFSFGQAIIAAIIGFGIIAIAGQQRKKTANTIFRKRLQRLRFFLMGISCTLLITGFYSTRAVSQDSVATNVLAAFTGTEKKTKPVYENYTDNQAYHKDLKAYYSTLSRQEIRREFRLQLKQLKQASSPVGRVLIALIIILLVAIALNLVAALSCGLACNGQGALALLVLIFGTAGVVLLTVLLVKAVRKQEKKSKESENKKSD